MTTRILHAMTGDGLPEVTVTGDEANPIVAGQVGVLAVTFYFRGTTTICFRLSTTNGRASDKNFQGALSGVVTMRFRGEKAVSVNLAGI